MRATGTARASMKIPGSTSMRAIIMATVMPPKATPLSSARRRRLLGWTGGNHECVYE